jgi:hypothetical protein
MITFFAYPKPWLPEFTDIQSAAIKSWQSLKPFFQIVLLGDDEGTQSAAQQLGVDHIASVERNEWGTPLVSSIFKLIQENCKTELACFINADIVLGQDFMDTLSVAFSEACERKDTFLVGRRTDLALALASINDDLTTILSVAKKEGKLHDCNGIDYFVFPRDTFKFVYPFALGKFVWDQWLLGNAFRRGMRCIDCTETIFAVHLNAPWFFGGRPETDRKRIYDSEESVRNRSFDYYQRHIGNGTTHYTKWNSNGKVEIIAIELKL